MRLIKLENGQIAPECEDDIPMFMHCSNGSISATQDFYFGFVEPMLEAHGVVFVNLFELDYPQPQ